MYSVCRLSAEHLSDVAVIERATFSEPWSENALELLTAGGGVGFVAMYDGRAVAYGGMLCVLDEGQITNVAVDEAHRRHGLARRIVYALSDYGKERGIKEIFLEVRHSNAAAQALYRSCGFENVGERRHFYKNPPEDALLMRKIL